MTVNIFEKARRAATKIYRIKHPQARVIFLAGSIVRGESTETSDLDLVVVYEKLPNAFRESFYFNDFPVETFVHDVETLAFFLEREAAEGLSPLLQMISEAVEIPEISEFSRRLKKEAKERKKPKPPDAEETARLRYSITNLIDDIRAPRSKFELTATGTALYDALAKFYFRANNLWSAKDKSIPRALKKADADFQEKFCAAFEELFINGKSGKVIELAEEILLPHGGFLFDGYRSDAPSDFRKIK